MWTNMNRDLFSIELNWAKGVWPNNMFSMCGDIFVKISECQHEISVKISEKADLDAFKPKSELKSGLQVAKT